VPEPSDLSAGGLRQIREKFGAVGFESTVARGAGEHQSGARMREVHERERLQRIDNTFAPLEPAEEQHHRVVPCRPPVRERCGAGQGRHRLHIHTVPHDSCGRQTREHCLRVLQHRVGDGDQPSRARDLAPFEVVLHGDNEPARERQLAHGQTGDLVGQGHAGGEIGQKRRGSRQGRTERGPLRQKHPVVPAGLEGAPNPQRARGQFRDPGKSAAAVMADQVDAPELRRRWMPLPARLVGREDQEVDGDTEVHQRRQQRRVVPADAAGVLGQPGVLGDGHKPPFRAGLSHRYRFGTRQ
jgi:hypothetical protein